MSIDDDRMQLRIIQAMIDENERQHAQLIQQRRELIYSLWKRGVTKADLSRDIAHSYMVVTFDIEALTKGRTT